MADDTHPRRRIIRGILYQIALLPPTVMLLTAALVYTRTHPLPLPQPSDPLMQGIYYEPINLLTEDDVRLDAWLVPALDAQQVTADGDQSLHERFPAVVLVHGFGMSRQQVLPLVAPLHQRGWVVLALAMRGSGSVSAGQTFGLNESLDVKAAVELLRRRPYVDAAHIAVVGIGSGANAAIIAADRDPALTALVLDSPTQTGDQALLQHIVPASPLLRWWLLPVCKVAFTVGYGVDVDDLDVSQYGHVLAARPTLLMRWPQDARGDLPPQRVTQITQFLDNVSGRSSGHADVQP